MASKTYSNQVFAPNDPFKPSIHYGVKHITSRRPEHDDLYAAPTMLQASQRYEPKRSGGADLWGGDWGNDSGWRGWGRNNRTDPGNWSPNGYWGRNRKQNVESQTNANYRGAPARPAWRTVPQRERGREKRRKSPDRGPSHAAFSSPVRTHSPHPRRGRHSRRPSPSRRSRSPLPRHQSESVYSSRSRRYHSPSIEPWGPPRTPTTDSPPTGAQFELAVPNTSAPGAIQAIIERTSSSDRRSSLPPIHPELGRTPRTQRSGSSYDLQIYPPKIGFSDSQFSGGRPRSPPVFGPVAADPHDRSKSRSPSPAATRTPSARAESSLGDRFQMIAWKRVTPITSWSVIEAADVPQAHTSVEFEGLEHTSTPLGHTVDKSRITTQTYVKAFVLDTLPRQLYTYALLRLPHMYFSRVTRIFEEAELSMPQIKQGIVEAFVQTKGLSSHNAWNAWMEPPTESIAYSTLSNTWEGFIDSVLREWKTLNIISVLLLS